MYIYKADTYCDDCAELVCSRLNLAGKAPANPADESTYDSDDYPKHCCDDDAHGELDTPCHCACGEDCVNAITLPSRMRIGKLLGTNLTPSGVDYIIEQIRESPSEVTEFWQSEFGPYYDELRAMAH